MSRFFEKYGLYCAWLVSFAALFGSLYLGEILDITPCNLCWYQRICIYPLVLILGIATYRHDKAVTIYAIPLALIGAAIALYHILYQYYPFFRSANVCGKEHQCAQPAYTFFNYITLPHLSLISFLLIALLLYLSTRKVAT